MDSHPPPAASPFGLRPLRSLRFALLNFALTADHPGWRSAARGRATMRPFDS
jgi:hypothetical protein